MLEIILAICAAVALLLGWRHFQSKENIDAKLARLSRVHPELDYKHSVVDLMKLLDMDSSLENRKLLAREYGYAGELSGSAEMNFFLHREIKRRY